MCKIESVRQRIHRGNELFELQMRWKTQFKAVALLKLLNWLFLLCYVYYDASSPRRPDMLCEALRPAHAFAPTSRQTQPPEIIFYAKPFHICKIIGNWEIKQHQLARIQLVALIL
jgi:hypothetical protein